MLLGNDIKDWRTKVRVELGEYILDVNVEETKNTYEDEVNVSEGCECDGCKNYELAVEQVSLKVKNLFQEIGIEIKKPAEVYVNYSQNNILCYGGFYHICGNIMMGESPWEIIPPKKSILSYMLSVISKPQNTIVSHLNEEKMISIAENYKVAFKDNCDILSKSFQGSCIQMEILAYLPWLLNKPNSYEN